MKYIRTANKIYRSDRKDIKIENGCVLNYEAIIYHTEEKIIEESDNLEELCDEFVIITNEYRKIGSLYECEYLISAFKKKIKSNNPIIAIYGAIWTNKGLIYVAKMNDKGELELL